MRATFSPVRFALVFLVLSAGCFRGVDPTISKIECKDDNNCPEPYRCVKETPGAPYGRCVSGNADAGKDQGQISTLDSASAEVPSDGRQPDVQKFSDSKSAEANPQSPDAGTGIDVPPLVVDALLASDTPVTGPDTSVPGTDASVDAPFTPADTAPPCNGGCCSNADCPLSTPVCNGANKCVGCTGDQDCSGRSATACNTSTGVCVQCTKKDHCSGANATCDLSKNVCVGCTQRSDCPGTCQTCNNGTCVSVKNADDPTKCTGTCDSTGECRAKKGQKCSSVTGGCVSGTTCSPDDTCCDRACTGSCEACDLATAPGTCTVLAAGSLPHTGHTSCAGTGTCAGTCQGAADGSCTLPTSACGTSSCTGGNYQALGTCQQGTCSMPAPVACKPGATCSAGACACPSGTSDCDSACANLDSDPKNCGACGHDCLGGPCEGGFCRPYKLGDVATGRPGVITVDGSKVYVFTSQEAMFETTKVWQTDTVTPGNPGKIPPDQTHVPSCVIDGTMVWPQGISDGQMVFGYCSVSGCLTSTKTFSRAATSTTSFVVYPVCDIVKKQMVWVESDRPETGDVTTYSIWRSSVSGQGLEQMTSFPITSGGYLEPHFPSGRSDRVIYTVQGSTTANTYSVLTTTKNAQPVLLATGANAGPSDLMYAAPYANDSLLVWSSGGTSYKMPLPNGVGTADPPVFTGGTILSGIMDNYHFYGFFENRINALYWCSSSNCSTVPLSGSFAGYPKVWTQDAGAIYFALLNDTGSDGFTIWKVAKQPY